MRKYQYFIYLLICLIYLLIFIDMFYIFIDILDISIDIFNVFDILIYIFDIFIDIFDIFDIYIYIYIYISILTYYIRSTSRTPVAQDLWSKTMSRSHNKTNWSIHVGQGVARQICAHCFPKATPFSYSKCGACLHSPPFLLIPQRDYFIPARIALGQACSENSSAVAAAAIAVAVVAAPPK